MNKLFNTPFENGIRVLLALFAISPSSATLDRLVAYDFMSIYGADFEISEFNLHGSNTFNFSELPAKRSTITEGIKEMTLNGMIAVKQSKAGFVYSLSSNGISYVNSLTNDYAAQYIDAAKKVHGIYHNKTDIEITAAINSRAIKTLRR